jgi:hypothetical protein
LNLLRCSKIFGRLKVRDITEVHMKDSEIKGAVALAMKQLAESTTPQIRRRRCMSCDPVLEDSMYGDKLSSSSFASDDQYDFQDIGVDGMEATITSMLADLPKSKSGRERFLREKLADLSVTQVEEIQTYLRCNYSPAHVAVIDKAASDVLRKKKKQTNTPVTIPSLGVRLALDVSGDLSRAATFAAKLRAARSKS